MMRVGLDVYSVGHLKLSPLQILDYCIAHNLDGAHFFTPLQLSPTLDPGEMAEIAAEAARRGLYFEVGLPSINAHRLRGWPTHAPIEALGEGDYRRGLERCIRACRAFGCRELRSHLGARGDRLNPTDPWAEQIRDTTAFLATLRPLLVDLDCRINVETHADCASTELVRMVEALGEDVQGICLDIGNTFRQLEDPVAATRRAAPYTHITHTKDAILFFTERGLAWQTRPCGRGAIDWSVILPILAAHAPDLTLSIEDEPYVRELPIFDPGFLAFHPDLRVAELAELTRIGWTWTERIKRGDSPEPYDYEKTGWYATDADRIDSAVGHLKAAVGALGAATPARPG
jgi:sugar phosphate isomerase/epimerase